MQIKKGTIIVDLVQDICDLWKNVHQAHRRSVKKAEKHGCFIRQGGDENICYDLYKEMCKFNLLIPRAKEKVFSEGDLFVGVYSNKIIAFSVIEDTGEGIKLLFNASDYTHRNIGANVLLYLKIMLFYKMKGKRFFDLGGIDLYAQHRSGTDEFKIRWGGELINLEQEVSFLEYIWWKFFRHYAWMRKLKYSIQSALK